MVRVINLRHGGHIGGIHAVGVGVVAKKVEIAVVPMPVVMTVDVGGVEETTVGGGILVAERGVVRPDVIPWVAHRVQRRIATSSIGTVSTAQVDPEQKVVPVPSIVEIGVGEDGAGTAVGTENVNLKVFNGRMFHLDAYIEDVVGIG